MNMRAPAVVASLLILAGCGGGGGSAVAPQQSPPTNTPAAPQSATVTFIVPRNDASAGRSPLFVSPNSTTLTVTVLTVDGSAPTATQVPPSVNPTVAQLSTGAGGNCTAITGGLSCTVQVPAPTGAVKYSFKLSDSQSRLLALSTPTFNVTAASKQTFQTQLNGVVSTAIVTAPTLQGGVSFSGPITVQAFDASGAQIVGSAAYANAFTLTDGDATGHTSLTNNGATGANVTVGSANDVVILNFDGSNQIQPFQIAASGGTQAGTAQVTGGGPVGVSSFSASNSTNVNFNPSSPPATVPLPSAGGYSGSLTLSQPLNPLSATINLILQNTGPSSGVPSLASGRAPLAQRAPLANPYTVLIDVQFKSNVTVQFPVAPGFSITIPQAVSNSHPNASYYVAFYDFTAQQPGWNLAFEGPASVNGNTLTFASNGRPFTVAANKTYDFALLVFDQGSATPTPAPTPAAIGLTGTTIDDAAHGGKPTDPNWLQPSLFFVLPNQTQAFTASQTGTSAFVLGLENASCGTGGSAIASFTTSDNKTFNVKSSTTVGFCKAFLTGAEGSGVTLWFTNTSAVIGPSH